MQKTFTTLIIIFIAFLFSSIVYLLIGFLLTKSPWHPFLSGNNIGKILFTVFTAISAGLILLLWKLKQNAFSGQMPRPESLDHLQRYVVSRYVLFFALSEAPAIFGLVCFLLSGDFSYLLLLCGLSLISFGLVRPSLEALNELQRRFSF